MLIKHLLTVWFLVFTLSSSVAWANAGHDDQNHATPSMDKSMGHDEPLPWQNDGCSDHCCHAAAHVVALIGGVSLVIALEALSADLPISGTPPYSWPLAPPYHPPIA